MKKKKPCPTRPLLAENEARKIERKKSQAALVARFPTGGEGGRERERERRGEDGDFPSQLLREKEEILLISTL